MIEFINVDNNDETKRFQVGKCYRYKSCREMKIIGVVESTVYGICFIGETPDGDFKPIGVLPINFSGWFEISKEEFEKSFK
jgi:hypothetical protein